jgi:hypothetical protein
LAPDAIEFCHLARGVTKELLVFRPRAPNSNWSPVRLDECLGLWVLKNSVRIEGIQCNSHGNGSGIAA